MFVVFFLNKFFKIKDLQIISFLRSLWSQVVLVLFQSFLFSESPNFQHNIDYKTLQIVIASKINIILKHITNFVKGVVL